MAAPDTSFSPPEPATADRPWPGEREHPIAPEPAVAAAGSAGVIAYLHEVQRVAIEANLQDLAAERRPGGAPASEPG